jgi:hypothetical protein
MGYIRVTNPDLYVQIISAVDMDGVVNSEEYLVDKILENINIDITQ